MTRHRCAARLWTPEQGASSWLTCERRGAHRGTHRASDAAWTSDECMDAPAVATLPRWELAPLRTLTRLRSA